LQAYKEESQHYRLKLETAKQDLAVVQEQLKQQVEAARRGPSATTQNLITMLKSQVQDKDAKEQLLSQTVADLEVCFPCHKFYIYLYNILLSLNTIMCYASA